MNWQMGCQLQFEKYCLEQYWSYLYPFLDMPSLGKLAKICTNVIAHADWLIFLKHGWKYSVCSCTFDLSFADDLLGLMFPLARSSKAFLETGLLMFPLARSKFKGLSQTSSLWLGEINGLAFCRELLSWIIFPLLIVYLQYSYGKVRKTKVDFFERHGKHAIWKTRWIWHKENILSDFRE